MTFNNILDLVAYIHTEDSTFFEELINTINTNKMSTGEIRDYLRALPETNINKITTAQLLMFKQMQFKNNDMVYMYYNDSIQKTLFDTRWQALQNTSWHFTSAVGDLPKESIKFLSSFLHNKWKSANPSATIRKSRGVNHVFSMDEFSLSIFKNSVKAPFLRTEAKNIIERINIAYKAAVNGKNDNYTAISIRNRFYKIVLDNTEVHTKAMLNSLHMTQLEDGNVQYIPHPEETIALHLWNKELHSLTTSASVDTYANDLRVVTDCKIKLDTRETDRAVTAASVCTFMFTKTQSPVFLDIAKRFINTTTSANKLAKKIEAATLLLTIIKEKEQREQDNSKNTFN